MARDSQRLEQEFIQTVYAKTGKELGEWLEVIRGQGFDKPTAMVKGLKEDHNLNHMQATFLAGIYLNDGKAVYDYEVLFHNLFDGKEHLLPTYHELERMVQANFPDVDLIPTRTYVSIEGRKIFACATLTKATIRVGLDLGDMPFGDTVEKAKSLGAMPNLTHMVEVRGLAEVNQELLGHLRMAYERVHKK